MHARILISTLTLGLVAANALAASDAPGSLPAVTVQSQRTWTPADAHDYTGMAPPSSAASIAALPVWNSRMAQNYDGDAGAHRTAGTQAPLWTAASAHDYDGDSAHL